MSAETRHAEDVGNPKVWKNKGVAHTSETISDSGQDGTAGSRQSFQELAAPLIDGLYRYAMKLTNSPEDAQDLVQDTFERGFKHFDSFRQGTNFAAWMTTIERNLLPLSIRGKV